jgi:hypothetical protein
MRSVCIPRVWIAAAALGAATVTIISAQAPQPPAGGRGGHRLSRRRAADALVAASWARARPMRLMGRGTGR